MNFDRAAKLLDAGRDGQSVEALDIAAWIRLTPTAFGGAGENVERAGLEIDDRRGCDADFGMDERA